MTPTILDAAGIPAPAFVHGIQQMPLHGVSMRYFFDDPAAPERRETQYFEIMCNRGIYHKGWTAVTRHSLPWVAAKMPVFDDDTWELYDTGTDWTQAHDLAAQQPEKLKELQRLFLIEAAKYGALPLDDRRAERFLAEIAGRPELVTGTTQLLFGGMARLSESSVINTKNVSHSVTADVKMPQGSPSGVLIAQGGAFGGWSLFEPVPWHRQLGSDRGRKGRRRPPGVAGGAMASRDGAPVICPSAPGCRDPQTR